MSMIMLEPGKFACVDVTVCRLSSLLVVMVNARLFVSASDDSTVYRASRLWPVIVGVGVVDAMLTVVLEPIVPFATRFRVITSPVFAYEEFALLLVIVNVVIASGFASTVTVLFIESGMFPAASDGAEYVMFCAPSDDVSKSVIEAVKVCGYELLPSSDMMTP